MSLCAGDLPVPSNRVLSNKFPVAQSQYLGHGGQHMVLATPTGRGAYVDLSGLLDADDIKRLEQSAYGKEH